MVDVAEKGVCVMNEIQKSILSGIFFGVWPLMMNRSGLSGNLSAVTMVAVSLICITPFTINNMGNLANANWFMGVGAGIVAALGLMSFNGMLASASVDEVGTLFVVMTVVQVAVAASYHIWMNGHISLDKIIGFILAGIASYILLR